MGKAMASFSTAIVASLAIGALVHPASAWSTFYNAKANAAIANTHQRQRHGSLLQHPRHGWMLHALPGEDEEYGSGENGGEVGDGSDYSGGERRRKRDILKRTLGLGSSGGSGNLNSDGDQQERVKLNTDSLFEGMPGMDSILGGPSSSPLSSMPDMMSSASSGSASIDSSSNRFTNDDKADFQKEGEIKNSDLLSPADLSALEAKYNQIKSNSESLVAEELSKGSRGEILGGQEYGKDFGQFAQVDGENAVNITQEEAKKIVDYAIEEEKLREKRQLNEMKKREMVAEWEDEGRKKEALVEQELEASGDGGQGILNQDGVAREIIANAEERENAAQKSAEQRQELDFYERQILQRNEIEGVVEQATSKLQKEQGGGEVDIDEVYEEALNQIQTSRKTRLGPKTLGVFANSIALEEGREYARNRKKDKEFLLEVEREAGLENASDEEIATFFRAPCDLEEERIYRGIVRQIVDKREAVAEAARAMEAAGSFAATTEDGDDEDSDGIIYQEEDDAKTKYKLSPKETVEAYKLLNLWRQVHSEQTAMETALGMKDDTTDPYTRRPLNKVEPFFLYEEDSEEKRLKEKIKLQKVLKKGLASEDDVESASNEVLMKELLEGGITKDRAVRLLDKLMAKAEDEVIMSSLKELREVILEEEEAEGEGWADEVGGRFRFDEKKSRGPIDLSGVFRTSEMEEVPEAQGSAAPSESSEMGGGRTMPSWASESSPPPPNTPFFQQSSTTQEEGMAAEEIKVPPPPNTPFFQSTTTESEEMAEDTMAPTGGMFGTYEEQRLQKLANKVGAKTEEEVEELRRNMEALKEAEDLANAQLSDDDFDIAAASAKLGLDVDSLNLEDDSDDQIMSIIGKRPVGGVSTTESTAGQKRAVLELNEEESEDIIVDATGHLKKMEAKKIDIADDIFRSKTAGKYSDAATRDAAEAAYKEFVKMEEEAEQRFESTYDDAGAAPTLSQDIDVDEYADDIMSEMKPRPRVKGRKEEFMSQEEMQRERKKESIFGDEDPFPTKGGQQGTQPTSNLDGSMPEWFRKEQEAMGIEVEDNMSNEDDLDEARREWEREERQRKADEYLKQRGEGISISDVLGREYFGPMDEPDDNYEMRRSTFDSFQARKDLLLGYTELTVEDINNVVDYKVDPLATGYNQYLPAVQRPFSQYGALFRLEGVLVDMIGMHAKAWKHAAEAHGYQIETSDDVRQASLYKPEDAVREVFHWTDDIFEVRDIAETQRGAFHEAFDNWLASNSPVVTGSNDEGAGSSADSSDARPKVTPSDEEMNSMYYLAWSKLANNLDMTAPTNDQVYRGIMGGDWEAAVKDIFGWSDDPDEVYNIVVAYDEILQADYRVLLNKYGIDLDAMDAKDEETLFGLQFPDASLKEGVGEWLDTLREVDMPCAVVSHLDSSQLDAILNATGLAEYFPPDKRVSFDSGYSSERSELLGAALRVEQRPDQCIVFDNTPHSAKEAHEVCMKSVSFVDHYARYELLTADLSVGYARDLELQSLVKLFDKREDMEPLLELDVSSGLQKQQRKVKTAFWDE